MREDDVDPDTLLKAIQDQEQQKKLGKLKVFFGMSAGVGKTFSMLEEAHQKINEGYKVVIGTINTHGRKETEELVQGIPVIPEKWIKYKDTVFEEMDLEVILDTKPDIVLVDELAHTNVPGAKHPKRWQDVLEILDAGIDVYTTVNVQHLESRKDIVESLTGIQIRETIPDLVLERATSIELVDVPPPKLLQRMQEGKVYLGDQSKIAAAHFFTEENLTALREISLRFTAEKVDHDLHGILQAKGWKNRERLMVAISSSPSSEQLIRAARRLAFELDAPWIVVYVDSGKPLSNQDQSRLNRHFILARELGAEVVTSYDLDVATAIQRIAKQKDITRIIVGRPQQSKWAFFDYFRKNFLDRLESENKNVDIVILRKDKATAIFQKTLASTGGVIDWHPYAIAAATVAAITGISLFTFPLVGSKSVGFVYLFGILGLSLFLRRGPIFLAAFLSTFCWNFFFIKPTFSTKIAEVEDIILIAAYFVVAAVLGWMTSRMHEQDQFLKKREEKIERLYEIEREITNSKNFQSLRRNVCERLSNGFSGGFDILIKDQNDNLHFDTQLPLMNNEKEKAAANWVFEHGKIGGWSTDTLPSADGIYFPIKFGSTVVGVIVYAPTRERTLSIDETNFIMTVAQQLGLHIERYIFEERLSAQDYSRQLERLYRSIFNAFDQSFYVPLEKMEHMLDEVKRGEISSKALAEQTSLFLTKIKLSLNNIMIISQVESGFTHFDSKKQSLKQLIATCKEDIFPLLNGQSIHVEMPSNIEFYSFDYQLLRCALNNLLVNALEHSDEQKPVEINVSLGENQFLISVIDHGPAIPDAILPRIFDKFYHEKNSSGIGLGLTAVKAIVDIHQGGIAVKNLDGYVDFTMTLPNE